ncbi:carboxypeptidase-like regulatory domain-containing protein [Nocardiopsis sp. RSe5-2]|uniref:Carboxypeptidase-like regulatory domain-containing protein n=1 Tax=Nocardiopsis endophytica TaxID=3018445 RepID=A0ABT4TWS3_9ACTN|nr:carboxypeptidase-like regulatory domain-containing protein [Nocardiopsis endophytica]MDA2809141.1 carboxypeptidase-like regulatory domain-containing protein [Nocardiopsis endophytica]
MSSAERPKGSGESKSDRVRVSGKVLDSDGEPVEGVFIRQEYVGDDPPLLLEGAIFSGSNGQWSLVLEPGDWNIYGSLEGEETSVESVNVGEREIVDVELRFS